jgi:hypothetical protein
VNEFFSVYLILPAALGPGFAQPLIEMRNVNIYGFKVLTAYNMGDLYLYSGI